MSLVKEIIEKCRQNSIKVLTGPGGIYEINPKLRDLLCLTSDYTLHVLKGNTFSPNVLGFRDQLRRKKVDISEPREVSLTLLQAFYSELVDRSEEHTSELKSLMRISYAVFCLKKQKIN